jgi:hypothetical protein
MSDKNIQPPVQGSKPLAAPAKLQPPVQGSKPPPIPPITPELLQQMYQKLEPQNSSPVGEQENIYLVPQCQCRNHPKVVTKLG